MATKRSKSKTEDIPSIDTESTGIDPRFESQIIERLREVEGIMDYLRLTMSEDIKRHFNAPSPLDQAFAKGAYFRTRYIFRKIQESSAKKEIHKRKPEELGTRYLK